MKKSNRYPLFFVFARAAEAFGHQDLVRMGRVPEAAAYRPRWQQTAQDVIDDLRIRGRRIFSLEAILDRDMKGGFDDHNSMWNKPFVPTLPAELPYKRGFFIPIQSDSAEDVWKKGGVRLPD